MVDTTSPAVTSRAVTSRAVLGPGIDGRVTRLASAAAEAAQVRALTTHPDVIALRVERVRAQVDALLWAGIVLGLAFTMVNVQAFAATTVSAPVWSLGWWVAWLLDPMVSLVLLAVLRAEQVTARWQVPLPAWGRRTKWLTFAATYVMNTWTSWGLAGAPLSAAGVVLHSIPPLVVFASAETGPGLRDRLTEAVRAALTEHAAAVLPVVAAAAVPAVGDAAGEASRPARRDGSAPELPGAPSRGATRGSGRRKARPSVPRRLLADFLADARAAVETAGAQVAVTPSWVREVTGCSAGTSVKVAAALRTEHGTSTTSTSTSGTSTNVPTLGEVA